MSDVCFRGLDDTLPEVRVRNAFEAWASRQHDFLFDGDDQSRLVYLVAFQAWRAALESAAQRIEAHAASQTTYALEQACMECKEIVEGKR